jgi:hypothetical protein
MDRLETMLKVLLLLGVITVLNGCATEKPVYDDPSTVLQPSESKEDSSHGWGTSVQNNSY